MKLRWKRYRIGSIFGEILQYFDKDLNAWIDVPTDTIQEDRGSSLPHIYDDE